MHFKDWTGNFFSPSGHLRDCSANGKFFTPVKRLCDLKPNSNDLFLLQISQLEKKNHQITIWCSGPSPTPTSTPPHPTPTPRS